MHHNCVPQPAVNQRHCDQQAAITSQSLLQVRHGHFRREVRRSVKGQDDTVRENGRFANSWSVYLCSARAQGF